MKPVGREGSFSDRIGPLRACFLGVLLFITFLGLESAAAQDLPWVVKEPASGSRILPSWARALLSTGNYALAASYLEEEVKANPTSVEGHMLLGKAYWGLGRIRDAKGAWEKAASLSPVVRPLVELRLARLKRLEELTLLSFYKAGEGEAWGEALLSALTERFSALGFKVIRAPLDSPLGRLFHDLWAGTPKALEEAAPMVNLLVLVEALLSTEGPGSEAVKPALSARLRAKAVEVRSRRELARVEWTGGPGEAKGPSPPYVGKMAEELLSQILEKERLQPDLVTRPGDVVLPRLSLVKGVAVPVELTVRNQGDDEAKNLDVRIWDVSPEKGQALRAFRVASLPPLSSAVLSFEWVPSGIGLHKLTIGIDPDKKIAEADRSNNTASKEVLILSEEELQRNLYEFALSYTPRGSKEQALLEAERHVMLNPKDKALFGRLLQLAIDYEKEAITVIGVGIRPWNVVSEAAGAPVARRLARQDAQRWLALIQSNREKTLPSAPKGQIYGARVIAEQRLPDGSYWVKVLAPLE
ncbi:MAG: hypothetical protein HY998_03150 [candidate division NC10 bacterium]|nr:hypothetical protein [candidate division NC10 bacterium]